MSPEQAAGRLDLLGPASDIYGLGATLYHLIVGRPPITSLGELAKIQSGDIPRPSSLAPWIDPALEAICLKAMALKPSDRYATPRTLAEDLDRWIAGEPVTAYREPFGRRARRWAKKHRTVLTTAASVATVAALLFGVFTWQRLAQRQRIDASALASLAESERLAKEAQTGDSAQWVKAAELARRAVEQLELGGSPALLREAKARFDVMEPEGRMILALEEARFQATEVANSPFDSKAGEVAYLAAFRAYGIDVGILPIEEAAKRIRSSLDYSRTPRHRNTGNVRGLYPLTRAGRSHFPVP
jgi:hypothetical protein